MSGQNTSHAVMAQRSEPHDSLDDFPTPPWGTRALIEKVLYDHDIPCGSVWEPACNRGYMARPLMEYFPDVHCSDIHDYGWEGQERICDFLFPGSEPPYIAKHGVDWIITNPPFRLAAEFVFRALEFARYGVAVLVRTVFLESVGRYNNLFHDNPPTIFAQFTERLPIHRGKLTKNQSTATAYCWLVWIRGAAREPVFWIPPCRKELERPNDYEVFT